MVCGQLYGNVEKFINNTTGVSVQDICGYVDMTPQYC